jgi:autotransporter-associated beta strand protein
MSIRVLSRMLVDVVASLAVATSLVSTAQAAVIADWQFNDGALLVDSSGNGHDLVVSAGGTVGNTGGNAVFSKAGWLQTAGNLNLLGYRSITVSYGMNCTASPSEYPFMYEQNTPFFNNPGSIVNYWQPGTDGAWAGYSWIQNGAIINYNISGYTATANETADWVVAYDLDLNNGTTASPITTVYKNGTQVSTLLSTNSLDNPCVFATGIFNIGGRADGTYQMAGTMSYFRIEGTAPEPVPVTWAGGGSAATWSTTPGSSNWKDTAGGGTADYVDGAAVTFDDSATGGLTADISTADVAPASVVFNNNVNEFVITGSKGIVWGATVTKEGTGTATMNSVNVYTGATIVKAGTLRLGTAAQLPIFTFDGGADIQGGKLVLDYATTAPNVLTPLAAAYATGWTDGRIRNTTAATTGLTLGWKDDAMALQVTIIATYAGDADLSGTVDVADLTALLNNYNKTDMVWVGGDFNYDSVVNVADLTALLNNYNKSVGGSVAARLSVGGSAVPEPSTLALLATGLLGLLAYAWRKWK